MKLSPRRQACLCAFSRAMVSSKVLSPDERATTTSSCIAAGAYTAHHILIREKVVNRSTMTSYTSWAQVCQNSFLPAETRKEWHAANLEGRWPSRDFHFPGSHHTDLDPSRRRQRIQGDDVCDHQSRQHRKQRPVRRG